jgi:hypothetical protein
MKGVIKIKKCSICGTEKNKSEFYILCRKKYKPVLRSECKECHKEKSRERARKWNKKNIEQNIELLKNGLKKCDKCKIIKNLSEFKEHCDHKRRICNDCLNPKIITKICNKCNIEKPEDEFYCYSSKKGKKYTRNTCIECFNVQRNHLYSFYEIDEILNTNVEGV